MLFFSCYLVVHLLLLLLRLRLRLRLLLLILLLLLFVAGAVVASAACCRRCRCRFSAESKQPRYLPGILDAFEKSVKHQYLLLSSLKEVIVCHSTTSGLDFSPFVDQVGTTYWYRRWTN